MAEMAPITSWKQLVEVVHPWALEKGWWPAEGRPLEEQFANFHSEISEAWEEYRNHRMETWYSWNGAELAPTSLRREGLVVLWNPNASIDVLPPEWVPAKPEGFYVELADMVIRIADTCGKYGHDGNLIGLPAIAPPKTEAGLVCELHHQIAYGQLAFDGGDPYGLHSAVELAFAFAKQRGIDLWPVITEKHAYNQKRPWRPWFKKGLERALRGSCSSGATGAKRCCQ